MKKIWSLLILSVFLLIPVSANEVWNGVVHLTDPEILATHKIDLSGMWEFYPAQEFQSFYKEQNERAFIKVPGSWKVEAKKNYQSDFACYRLKIVGLKPNKRYAIFSRRSPATSSNFFCNGKKVASYGFYSSKKESAVPAELPVLAYLESDVIGSIELVIQVSSYQFRESGIITPILFGEEPIIVKHFRNIVILTALLIGALFSIGVINFSVYLMDKKETFNLIFTFLLVGVMAYSISVNGSLLFWVIPSIPFSFHTWVQTLNIWLAPALFSLLMLSETDYQKKFPHIDNIFFIVFIISGVVVTILPFQFSNFLYDILIAMNIVFYIYTIFRLSYAFANHLIKFGVFYFFYILIASGILLDKFFISYSGNQIILFNQIAVIVLLSMVVVYMAIMHQSSFNQVRAIVNNLESMNKIRRKFFSSNFIKMINDSRADKINLGESAKINTTIMYLQFVIVNPNGNEILPRIEFDTCRQFTQIAADLVDQNHGVVSNYLGRGCVALFKDNPNDALVCARQIMDSMRKQNSINVKMGEACALCNGSIHFGEVIVGVIGSKQKLDASIIGEGLNTASRIQAVALKYGIPFLVSLDALNEIDENPGCDVKPYPNSVISEKGNEIVLYECSEDSYKNTFKRGESFPTTPVNFKENEDIANSIW